MSAGEKIIEGLGQALAYIRGNVDAARTVTRHAVSAGKPYYVEFCPFCGSADTQIVETPAQTFLVGCGGCGAQGPMADAKHLAAAQWNKAVSK